MDDLINKQTGESSTDSGNKRTETPWDDFINKRTGESSTDSGNKSKPDWDKVRDIGFREN